MVKLRELLVLVLVLGLMIPAAAQDMTAPTVAISGVWARPAAGMSMGMMATEEAMDGEGMATEEAMPMHGGMGGETSAAYMFITNTGEQAISLVAGDSTVAGLIEIHENIIENDVMRMRPVEGGIVIAAGETVELRPGGLHVMLMDLQTDLLPETAFALDLTFAVLDDSGTPTEDTFDVALGVPVLPDFPPVSDLVITQMWARPTAAAGMGGMGSDATEEPMSGEMAMPMGGTSAVYMFIENRGAEDVSLISGATEVAGIVEIHETSLTDQGVMQMRPLMDGLLIPAGETVELRPGGFHVMLMDMQQSLVEGDTLYIELGFDNGDTLVIGAPIEDRLMMGGM